MPAYLAISNRWWKEGHLQHAFQHIPGPNARSHRLLKKLANGQPIVVAGFGSSVFASFAGCYPNPPRPDRFKALGIVPNPYAYPQIGQNWTHIHEHLNLLDINGTWLPYNTCHRSGFMTAVMTTINQTWPHSDHIFLNNAQRASRLDDLTDASCSDIYTPHDVDLVLLDVASTLSSPAAVENIVRKYAATRSDPVVILFSQVQLCRGEGRRGGNWSEERYTFCSRNCLFDLNQTACGLLDPEPFPRQENLALDNERQHYQEIAVRYDHPHFNMHHLVLALLNDEAAIASAGASSKWELLSRLFMDHIHFQSCYGRAVQIKDGSYVASNHFSCLPDQGPLLLADVIVSWLVEMQHQSQQTQKTDQPSLKPHPSLPPPIHNSSDSHYSIRCYGFSYQQIVASVDKDHDPLRIKEATVGTRNFGGFVQKDSSLSASFNPLPPLNVTRSEGWRLLNYYKKKDGTAIFKPGLVTSKIGSILEIVIDTSFTTDLAAIQLPEVILSYTESYDGWGSVAITCVTNCLCDGGIIDAAGSLKQSVIRSQVFTVTQNRNCHIRIESRGGKFKISGVVVRVQKETMKNTAGKHKS